MKQDSLALAEGQANPMQLIQRSLEAALASGDNGMQVANLLIDQLAKQRDYEDREAFNAALRRIQDKIKPVVKDCENKQTHSRYASAEAVDSVLDKLIEQERMTLSFTPKSSDKENEFIVVGILSLGAYSKEYPLPVPCDGKGPKGDGVMSRVHAVGSGVTYAKRYIKNMIFNLRFQEKDDDGNAAGGSKRMADTTMREWLDHITSAEDATEMVRRYIKALHAAPTDEDKRMLEEAANKRKRDFSK
jgi:hypothetical protein